MKSLSDFPVEILELILDHVRLDDHPRYGGYTRTPRGTRSLTTLARLSRTCSIFKDIATTRIYEDVVLDGPVRALSVAKFCRTILTRPDLACLVRSFGYMRNQTSSSQFYDDAVEPEEGEGGEEEQEEGNEDGPNFPFDDYPGPWEWRYQPYDQSGGVFDQKEIAHVAGLVETVFRGLPTRRYWHDWIVRYQRLTALVMMALFRMPSLRELQLNSIYRGTWIILAAGVHAWQQKSADGRLPPLLPCLEICWIKCDHIKDYPGSHLDTYDAAPIAIFWALSSNPRIVMPKSRLSKDDVSFREWQELLGANGRSMKELCLPCKSFPEMLYEYDFLAGCSELESLEMDVCIGRANNAQHIDTVKLQRAFKAQHDSLRRLSVTVSEHSSPSKHDLPRLAVNFNDYLRQMWRILPMSFHEFRHLASLEVAVAFLFGVGPFAIELYDATLLTKCLPECLETFKVVAFASEQELTFLVASLRVLLDARERFSKLSSLEFDPNFTAWNDYEDIRETDQRYRETLRPVMQYAYSHSVRVKPRSYLTSASEEDDRRTNVAYPHDGPTDFWYASRWDSRNMPQQLAGKTFVSYLVDGKQTTTDFN